MAGIDARGIALPEIPEEPFPQVGHEFRVHVTEEAFDRIVARGAADTSREVGGVLVGRVLKDESGPYVRVSATIDALHAEEKGTELTFTHATWDHVHAEMQGKHPKEKIVGWYHTHPGFGIFLSDRDQFIHRSFFNLPFQIAVVFDPLKREHGVFAWRDNEPVRIRRWWVGRREQQWDGAHPPQGGAPPAKPAREEASMPKEPRSDEAAAPPDLLSVALGVIVLLVVGGFAGYLMGQRGIADVAAKAETVIAQERLRATQETVQGLNADVIGLVARAVDTGARDAMLEGALSEVDATLLSLDGATEPGAKAIERLRKARVLLVEMRDGVPRARAQLQQLETLLRTATPDTRAMSREVKEHGGVLGQLCDALGDQAARAGDLAGARQLYTLAARCDPGGAGAYQKKIEALTGTPPK